MNCIRECVFYAIIETRSGYAVTILISVVINLSWADRIAIFNTKKNSNVLSTNERRRTDATDSVHHPIRGRSYPTARDLRKIGDGLDLSYEDHSPSYYTISLTDDAGGCHIVIF